MYRFIIYRNQFRCKQVNRRLARWPVSARLGRHIWLTGRERWIFRRPWCDRRVVAVPCSTVSRPLPSRRPPLQVSPRRSRCCTGAPDAPDLQPPTRTCADVIAAAVWLNETRMPVTAASPYQVPKSVKAKSDFGHFRSSEQHVDGCVWLAKYDFPLVFYSDFKWNCCWVISR